LHLVVAMQLPGAVGHRHEEGGERQGDHDGCEHHGLGQGVAHRFLRREVDDGRTAAGPAGDQEEDVDSVAHQDQADRDTGQGALEDQIDPAGDEHGGGDHQEEVGPEDVHGSLLSMVPARSSAWRTRSPASSRTSPWGASSAPSLRRTAGRRPMTTTKPPMSKNSEVTSWISPNTGMVEWRMADSRISPPKIIEARAVLPAMKRPMPSRNAGWSGAAALNSYRPPAR